MLTTAVRCSVLALILGATACGDDDPAGSSGGGGPGGAGGATSSSTTTGTTTSTTSSAQAVGGSGPGGGDAGSTGGAGGTGGEGGATEVGHPVEIALRVPDTAWNLEGVHVLVNDVDGALLEAVAGEELPTTVNVVAGQTITYVDARATMLSTHRVTPELQRIARLAGVPAQTTCDVGAEMPLAITFDEVPGAVVYRAQTGHAPAQEPTSPGRFELIFDTCTSFATFDVVITAESADGTVVGLATIRDVPYVPGEAAQRSVTLAPPARDPISFAISGLEGMSLVSGYGEWTGPGHAYLTIVEPGLGLGVVPTSDTLLYAPAIVDPGFGVAIAQVHVAWAADGASCWTSQMTRVGATDDTLDFDARGLRAPMAAGDSDLGWNGDGATGSIVYRQLTDGELWWTIVEDPAGTSGPAVFPEMPEHLADLPPAPGSLELRRIGHYALEELPYAAYLAGSDADGLVETSRATLWRPCD